MLILHIIVSTIRYSCLYIILYNKVYKLIHDTLFLQDPTDTVILSHVLQSPTWYIVQY